MQKIFDNSLKIFLLLSPLFIFKNYQVSLARSLFFVSGSLILFILSMNLSPKRVLKDLWFMIFILFMFLRVFLNGGLEHSEWFNFWYSMAGFFYVLCGALLFKTVYCYVDNIKQYFKPILIVCIINLILVLSQYFGHDLLWEHTVYFNPIYGSFDMPQQLGQYSAISIPILLYINPILTIIPLTCLILTKEVSAFVALFLGVLFYSFYKNKKFIIPILIIIFTFLLFKNLNYVLSKWYTRPIIWEHTVRAILQKPFLGWGYRSFNDIVIGEYSIIGDHQNPGAFNDYLHTAQEFGIPILLIILMFFKKCFLKFKNIYGKSELLICLASSIFIGLINMCGQGMIRYASVSGTFIILLAFFCIQAEKEYAKGFH